MVSTVFNSLRFLLPCGRLSSSAFTRSSPSILLLYCIAGLLLLSSSRVAGETGRQAIPFRPPLNDPFGPIRGGAPAVPAVASPAALDLAPPPTRTVSPSVALRRLRRRKRRALLLLRVAFAVATPVLLALALLSAAVSLATAALSAATLTLAFRDHAALSLHVTRLLFCAALAGVVGSAVSPTFAVFGLLAVSVDAAADLAVPAFRIAYRRQIRRIEHLMRLARDPVLVETLSVLAGAAQAGAGAVKAKADTGARRVAGAAKAKGREAISAADTAVEYAISRAAESPAVLRVRSSLPESALRWSESQVAQLRASGALQAAAERALQAGKSRLGGVEAALPYLKAIACVAQEEAVGARK